MPLQAQGQRPWRLAPRLASHGPPGTLCTSSRTLPAAADGLKSTLPRHGCSTCWATSCPLTVTTGLSTAAGRKSGVSPGPTTHPETWWRRRAVASSTRRHEPHSCLVSPRHTYLPGCPVLCFRYVIDFYNAAPRSDMPVAMHLDVRPALDSAGCAAVAWLLVPPTLLHVAGVLLLDFLVLLVCRHAAAAAAAAAALSKATHLPLCSADSRCPSPLSNPGLQGCVGPATHAVGLGGQRPMDARVGWAAKSGQPPILARPLGSPICACLSHNVPQL